ncbi:MAG: hypothetical protein AABW61_01615, partial [Candidatus Aenigmatarchaeota archaeon]
LTIELRSRLSELVDKYGKITSISASIFEKTDEEDMRRAWLFKPENGGIFMDLIHPVDIASKVLNVREWGIVDAKTFILQPLYDTVNPTAAEARFEIKGENFNQNSTIVVRVGKGLDAEHKKIRINFENAVVDLNYVTTEKEIVSGDRGEMKITSDATQTIFPKGPLSYEIMVGEMLRMLKGDGSGLTLEDIRKIYEPEWEFQEFSKDISPVRSKEEIQKFVQNGLKNI